MPATLPAQLILPRTGAGKCRVVSFLEADASEPWLATAIIGTEGTRGRMVFETYLLELDGAEMLMWKENEPEGYAATRFSCTCPAGRAKHPTCKHRDCFKAVFDWMTREAEGERPDGTHNAEGV